MDIKIITKCDRFLIHIETLTLQCLQKEMEKIGINLNDHLIYFYDNEEDKVVLLDDQDLQYAFNQKENIIKFYVYYKLNEPIINLKPSQTIIDDFKQDVQEDKKILQIEQDNFSILSRQEQKMTILPEERRRKKLRNAIEQYIDNLLFNEYEI